MVCDDKVMLVVVLSVCLLASAINARDAPACRPATNCTQEENHTEQTFRYIVNGKAVDIEFMENDFFHLTCKAQDLAADDPSLPAFIDDITVIKAEFTLCALPYGSYANALDTLNIKVNETLKVNLSGTVTPLVHTHSAGLKIDKLIIYGGNNIEDNFLSELHHLKSLELYNMNISTPLIFLALPVSLHELVLNQLVYPKIADDMLWLERLRSLTSLKLYHLKMLSLSMPKLANLSNLITIDINRVPTNLSKGSLAGSALRDLTLKSCGLSELQRDTFIGVNLTSLNLQNNGLANLPNGVFSSLLSLESLNLSGNKLTADSIERTLPALKRLRKLVLSSNPLGSLCGNDPIIRGGETSKLPPSLETLELQDTKTDRICVDWVADSALTDIDLQGNRIQELNYDDLKMKRTPAKTVRLRLNGNPLKRVDLTREDVQDCKDANSSRSLVQLDINTAIPCDCNHAWFREALSSCKFTASELKCTATHSNATPPVTYDTLQKYEPDELLCPYEDSCVPGCSCWTRVRDNAMVMWCEGHLPMEPISWPAYITHQPLVLHAPGAGLTRLPTGVLKELHISNNSITSLKDIPDTLRVLDVRNNRISHISEAAALKLARAHSALRVNLSGNPLQCDCASSAALLHLKTASDQVTDLKAVGCEDTRLVNELTAEGLCPSLLWPILAAVLSVMIIVVIVMAALWPRLKIHIKQYCFNHGMFLKSILNVSKVPDDPTKDNDVFISYPHRDRDKAMKLMQVLETHGYTTLDHARDFHPGCPIPENIAECIKRSKIILLLVTDNYAESKWCKHEFQIAHSVSIKGDTACVLVVLYPDADPKKLPQDMQVYIESNTYILADDVYFIKKMQVKLGERVPKAATEPPVRIEMELSAESMQDQSENEVELIPLAGNVAETVNSTPILPPTNYVELPPLPNPPAAAPDRPPTPSLARLKPPRKTSQCANLIELAPCIETVAG